MTDIVLRNERDEYQRLCKRNANNWRDAAARNTEYEERITELEAELQSVRQIAENRRVECNDNMRRIAESEAIIARLQGYARAPKWRNGAETMSLDGKPRKLVTQQDCEAWCYINRRTEIAVFIHTKPNGPTVTANISRRQLRKWIEATGRKP